MIKQRNIALCIVFSIITFGIYALYWFVCLTNDANQESGQTDATSGGVALLLTIVTCNIYGWFWAYKMGEKIDAIKTKNGQSAGNSSILFLLLQLCGLGIRTVYHQATQASYTSFFRYLDLELLHMRLCRTLQTNMQRLYLR